MPITNTYMNVERERISAQATVTAMQEAASIQRNYDTQLFLNDRYSWMQRERTERLRSLMTLLGVLGVLALVGWGLYLASQNQIQRHEVRVSLPPIPQQLPSRPLKAFVHRAEEDDWCGWDIVEDGRRLVGVRQSNGETSMFQLEDRSG